MHWTRREFLKAGAAAIASTALPSFLPRAARAAPGPKTKRVVLIAMAGGVRTRETLGTPANCPNLMGIVKDGCVVPRLKTANLGHYGATLAIFTGRDEAMGIRENEPGEYPTLFEYLRKQAKLPAQQVWLSTSAGQQSRYFAQSQHKDYGATFSANLVGGEGVFNAELKDLIEKFGRPSEGSEAEEALLEKLRRSLGKDPLDKRTDKEFANDPETRRRMEKFILDELTGKARLTGPGAGDAKAIRVAANILGVFKPQVLGIVVTGADVAHGSYNAYVETIRRNDDEIGRLWKAVQDDPDLKATTSLFILPEFGRDKDQNERGGLDHGDGSPDLMYTNLIAAGPDFAKGRVIEKPTDWVQVCPTVCALFGARPEHSKAKPIRELFA